MIASLKKNFEGLFATDRTRLRHVDGLRGISILLVMVGHFHFVCALRGIVGDASAFTSMRRVRGDCGVDIFFVISGFLIGSIVFSSMAKGEFSLLAFYKRRFLRLAPAYYLVIAVLLVLPPIPQLNDHPETSVYNLLYLSNMNPLLKQFMAWSWSLSIEEQFYWAFPPLVLLLARLQPHAVPLLILSWIPLGLAWMFALMRLHGIPAFSVDHSDVVVFANHVYGSTLFRSAGIACGVWVAWLCTARPVRERPPTSSRRMAKAVSLGLPVLVTVAILFSIPKSLFSSVSVAYLGISHTLVAACVALVLFHLHSGRAGALSAILEARVLVPAAKLAYSLYLLHPIVYATFADAFVARHVPHTDANIAALLALSVVGSFTGAALLYLFVEKPIMDRR